LRREAKSHGEGDPAHADGRAACVCVNQRRVGSTGRARRAASEARCAGFGSEETHPSLHPACRCRWRGSGRAICSRADPATPAAGHQGLGTGRRSPPSATVNPTRRQPEGPWHSLVEGALRCFDRIKPRAPGEPISDRTSLHKLANARRRALVDQSRAIIPRPAWGERVGVRGVLATAAPQVGQKAAPHPLAAPRAAPDLSPRAGRGDCVINSFTGSQAAAVTYANFGNEVLVKATAARVKRSVCARPNQFGSITGQRHENGVRSQANVRVKAPGPEVRSKENLLPSRMTARHPRPAGTDRGWMQEMQMADQLFGAEPRFSRSGDPAGSNSEFSTTRRDLAHRFCENATMGDRRHNRLLQLAAVGAPFLRIDRAGPAIAEGCGHRLSHGFVSGHKPINRARQKTASSRNVPLLGAARTACITFLSLQHRLIDVKPAKI
jgi:hypothetical protein